MKKNALLFLLLALISFSCLDEEETHAALPDGTYVGQFYRTSPELKASVAGNVTLVLNRGDFSGSSETPRYPAIGQGTFRQEGASITFQNASMWTADFDWSLILDKKFSVSQEADGTIVLTRITGNKTDVYRLKKQNVPADWCGTKP